MTDLELLARLILCEAGGEGEDGMKAVATVVMNRLTETRGEYGQQINLEDVIFADKQFTCAMTEVKGVYNPQNVYNVNPTQEHYDIAEWAIAGQKLGMVSEALWFYNPYSDYCSPIFPNINGAFVIRIGDHCFYNPKASYYLT